MAISKRQGYRNLMNAIVAQGANDYRQALAGKGYPYVSAEKVIREVEIFVHSEWYQMLTKLDGDYLLARLKKEHEERIKNESKPNTTNP